MLRLRNALLSLFVSLFIVSAAFGADLSQTATSVVKVSGTVEQLTCGGTVTAGMPVRRNTSNLIVSSSNDSAANSDLYGIALNGCATGQPILVQKDGVVNLGATLSLGGIVVLSTSGALSLANDVASGDYITVVCVAITTANCKIGIVVAAVAAAADIT